MSKIMLNVQIEIDGTFKTAGVICGSDYRDSFFTYDKDYISDVKNHPISISLPFKEEPFSISATQNFFEGLLPEGFSRQCVASNLHADSEDYISILRVLGSECLGAIRIVDEENPVELLEYKRLSLDEVKALAAEGASKAMDFVVRSHLSLTGASGKAGLFFDEKENTWYLPMGLAPSNYIVKQSHVRLKNLVINEQLCLQTAKKMGIDVPDSFIMKCGEGHGDDLILFATKRFDRYTDELSKCIDGLVVPYRLHQEDFAQAMGIKSAFKYEHDSECYLKRMFNLIRQYSSNPVEDQLKLWKITVFNYLIGNTDNHIKNNSLLYSKDLKSIHLAPCYDVVSTKIYDSGTDDMSLSINGKYNRKEITRHDFKEEAANIGLGQKIAMQFFDEMASGFSRFLKASATELEETGFSEARKIADRILE